MSIGSLSIFYYADLRPDVRIYIKNTIDKLGTYDAVHIRHSDYKTDYKSFLSEVADLSSDKIALCTDSCEVQRYAKETFSDRFICVNEIPDVGGKTLHGNKELDRYKTNLAALTDLFVLGAAKKLYTTYIDSGYDKSKGRRQSGFSKLAIELNKRPKLIERILNGE
ncbi:MAG: hypothetical protein LBI57_00075 [Helicobacteraceae bacterium]|jgi:hypothetical protein|nr:hypothetical protein [Helicobacteraceae bacterium]